jgi:hypothetical protein
LLTVISIVPTAVPAAITASTGIDFVSPAACYFYYFPYIKCKTYKTSSNSRQREEVENFANQLVLTALTSIPSCEKLVSIPSEVREEDFRFRHSVRPLHSFHISFTACGKAKLRCVVQNAEYAPITRPIARSAY